MEGHHQSVMIIFGGFYCSIGISAQLINLLLFYTFTKVPCYSILPFYTIARQLIVCDIVFSIIHLYVGAPSTLFERNVYESMEPFNTMFNFMLFLDYIAYKGTIVLVLLMAIHRVFIFMLPSIETRTFRGKWLIAWCLCAWLYIAWATTAMSFFGCQKTFSYKRFLQFSYQELSEYFFYWNCTEGTFSESYNQVNIIESYAIPLLTFVLNCFIVLHIWYTFRSMSSDSNRPAKQEINLLIQNFFLCALLMLHAVSYNIFGSISASNQSLSVYLTLLQNVISVSTSLLHPLTYLIFNKKVRGDVHSIFFSTVIRPTGKQSTVVVSSQHFVSASRLTQIA